VKVELPLLSPASDDPKVDSIEKLEDPEDVKGTPIRLIEYLNLMDIKRNISYVREIL
jgi:hypothetical protein